MKEQTVMDAEQSVESAEVITESNNNEVDHWSEDFNPDDQPVEESAVEETADDTVDAEEPPQEADLEQLYKKQLEVEQETKLDKPILVKYKGTVIEVDTLAEARDLLERGFLATFKAQEAAELRKQLEALQSGDLPQESVEQPVSGDVDVVAEQILNAPYAETFRNDVAVLNPADKQLLSTNPQILTALKVDYDKGIAQKVMPVAKKYMAVNGLDFLSAYGKATKEVLGNNSRGNKAQEIGAQPQPNTSVSKSESKDVWSMDSEAFKKYFDRTRQ